MSDKTSNTELEPKQSSIEPSVAGVPVSPDVLEKLPPDMKNIVLALSKQTTIGFPTNPITSKITAEHIGQIIESTENESVREFEFNKLELDAQQTTNQTANVYHLVYFVICLAFIAFLIVYLSSIDKALMVEVLKLILTFLSGIGVGFGIKNFRNKSKDDS